MRVLVAIAGLVGGLTTLAGCAQPNSTEAVLRPDGAIAVHVHYSGQGVSNNIFFEVRPGDKFYTKLHDRLQHSPPGQWVWVGQPTGRAGEYF